MIAEIKYEGFVMGTYSVMLNDGMTFEKVASYSTRKGALALVNKLLKADFARIDLHTEGHANLWRLQDTETPS